MATSKTSEPTSLKADEFWSRFIQPRLAHIQNVSPLDSTVFVEHARQTLDAELDAMTWAICRLRMRRNALSLMSSLPPELLARIFHFGAVLMPPSMDQWTRPGPLGWIHLTHVCKHWRETALQHPSLWGNINSEVGDPWRTLLLARAKSAPLSLSLPSLTSSDVDLIANHLSHMHRLSVLTTSDVLSDASQYFTSPATMLSSLELTAKAAFGQQANAVLPKDVFSGYTPMLREVHLDGVLLSWSSPIFTNLTTVSVRHYHDDSYPFRPSQYDHFLDALERMPNLEKLNLQHCLPLISEGRPQREHLTMLSHLEELTMEDKPAENIDLVKQFRIPSSCKLKFNCFAGLQRPIDDFLPFLEAYSQGAEVPFKTLLILFSSGTGSSFVMLKLWRESEEVDAEDTRGFMLSNLESDVTLRFPVPLDSTGPLEPLCQVLPLDALRYLSVSGDRVIFPAQRWTSMFGRCKGLERVDVNDGNAVHFCKALILPVDDGPMTNKTPLMPNQLFARNLQSLTISQLDFQQKIDGDDNAFIDEFMILLRQRADYTRNAVGPGAGGNAVEEVDGRLARLVMWGCAITETQVSRLFQLVQDIDWDKKEELHRWGEWPALEDNQSEGVSTAGSESDSSEDL